MQAMIDLTSLDVPNESINPTVDLTSLDVSTEDEPTK